MECKRCGNKDPSMFFEGHRGLYCRKCAGFKRILLEEELSAKDYEVGEEAGEYSFGYELTKHQKEASAKVLRNLLEGRDVLLHCVTGAGKTEIVVESLSYFIRQKKKVCYAIARKEVVIELAQRFERIFPQAEINAIYGGHHLKDCGDLIVCTTHQLFRFYHSFDLLVIDEADAFPLDGNQMLMNIALNSARGNIVFSTATLSPFLKRVVFLRNYAEVALLIRPSLKPMKVPRAIYLPGFLLYGYLFYVLSKMSGQCIVFVDQKSLAVNLWRLFKSFISCTYVYSDLEQRAENIAAFKEGTYRFIFSTTVLERGITIKGVSVIVLFTSKNSFDESSIIQMVGRVGRSVSDLSGEALILSNCFSKEITSSINSVKEANRFYEVSVL